MDLFSNAFIKVLTSTLAMSFESIFSQLHKSLWSNEHLNPVKSISLQPNQIAEARKIRKTSTIILFLIITFHLHYIFNYIICLEFGYDPKICDAAKAPHIFSGIFFHKHHIQHNYGFHSCECLELSNYKMSFHIHHILQYFFFLYAILENFWEWMIGHILHKICSLHA